MRGDISSDAWRVLIAVAQVGVRDDAERPALLVDHDDEIVRALADDALNVAERRAR